jgi:microcystin-dependent protein
MSLYNSLGLNEDPLPIGTILPYWGSSADIPVTFLLCDGSIIDPVEYPELTYLLGKTYSVGGVAYRLPELTNSTHYLAPSPVQGSYPSTGGLYPPEVATSTPVNITAGMIPSLTANKFTFTPQAVANSNVAMAGRYTNGAQNSTEQGVNTPAIIKLNSSTSAYVDITATSLVNEIAGGGAGIVFNLDAALPVQYGGIGMIYIIKAKYYQPTPAEIAVESIVAAQDVNNAFIRDLPNDVRNEAYNLTYLNPVAPLGVFVVESNNEAAAIATYGQGGGTTPEYSAVVGAPTYCPTLAGFQPKGKPTF